MGFRVLAERRGRTGQQARSLFIPECPMALKPFYGDCPWGVNVFLRFRLKRGA